MKRAAIATGSLVIVGAVLWFIPDFSGKSEGPPSKPEVAEERPVPAEPRFGASGNGGELERLTKKLRSDAEAGKLDVAEIFRVFDALKISNASQEDIERFMVSVKGLLISPLDDSVIIRRLSADDYLRMVSYLDAGDLARSMRGFLYEKYSVEDDLPVLRKNLGSISSDEERGALAATALRRFFTDTESSNVKDAGELIRGISSDDAAGRSLLESYASDLLAGWRRDSSFYDKVPFSEVAEVFTDLNTRLPLLGLYQSAALERGDMKGFDELLPYNPLGAVQSIASAVEGVQGLSSDQAGSLVERIDPEDPGAADAFRNIWVKLGKAEGEDTAWQFANERFPAKITESLKKTP